MITDLDMNCTLRGAVKVFNLACHLRHNDVLFPECIRTFQSQDMDVLTWMGRLATEMQHVFKGICA